MQRYTHKRLAATEPQSSDAPDEGSVVGDWRAFRASLVAKETTAEGAEPWASRLSQENLELFQSQDPALAKEAFWVHATEVPEQGGLVLAQPRCAAILDPRYHQLVIFLAKHDREGSVGFILNRPAPVAVGGLMGWGFSSAEGLGGAGKLQGVFAGAPVYHGGFYPPNRIARQSVSVLHGQGHLTGCSEVALGIFTGGEEEGAREVLEGKLAAAVHFRFFLGAMRWGPGALDQEIDQGAWYTAACSRSVVLRQCIQLPTPLWRECLTLIGGRHAHEARG
ncbi:hypothetical protein WJX81_002593 [Elliptochloris bilobata]|uniref:Uncharacterized protein n=1 Tax=Elliptochloris bilobata TaxID=381761 RepID=A0AAW1SKX6_9CHLO